MSSNDLINVISKTNQPFVVVVNTHYRATIGPTPSVVVTRNHRSYCLFKLSTEGFPLPPGDTYSALMCRVIRYKHFSL